MVLFFMCLPSNTSYVADFVSQTPASKRKCVSPLYTLSDLAVITTCLPLLHTIIVLGQNEHVIQITIHDFTQDTVKFTCFRQDEQSLAVLRSCRFAVYSNLPCGIFIRSKCNTPMRFSNVSLYCAQFFQHFHVFFFLRNLLYLIAINLTGISGSGNVIRTHDTSGMKNQNWK